MNKEDVAHIYNGILLGHKKKRNNAMVATWMDHGWMIIPSEVSRQRQISYDITYMWNFKK